MTSDCRLYVGPVSMEVLDAVLLVNSEDVDARVAICASVGQVSNASYTGISCAALKRRCERASNRPLLERDHLGRDAGDDWLTSDGPAWDQWRGEAPFFDAWHFHHHDFEALLDAVMPMPGNKSEWQIGPGEDARRSSPHPLRESRVWEGWVSAPLGPEIDGLTNASTLDFERAEQLRRAFPRAKIRCHACDYLPRRVLKAVKALCDGINVAPQLGVVQSTWYMQHAVQHGLDVSAWVDACLADERQLARWNLGPARWYGVGHYHFDKISWRQDVDGPVIEHLARFIKELNDA